MNKNYINAINKIQASDDFKSDTLKKIKTHGKESNALNIMLSFAACMIIALGIFTQTQKDHMTSIDLRDRIQIDSQAISACAMVNIEGIIIDVSNDGMSFQLNDGRWVYIDDDTQIGITATSRSAKDEQLIEPTFRIGNTISGFTEEEDSKIIYAYAIYTNWNYDNDLR